MGIEVSPGGGLPPPEPGQPEKVGIKVIFSDPPVRTIILVIFVVMLGFGIVLPVLPLYARSFGVGYDSASLLISGFAFTRLVVDPVSGPIVDRLGERVTAALGLAIVSVSSVLTGLAPTFALAVVFRSLGGAGSAMLFTALTSYLLKVVPRDRMGRTLGLFYGSFNIGVIAGGPVGGLVGERFGLASPLFVYAGLLVVSVVLFLRFVPDPGANAVRAEDEGRSTTTGELLRNRAFLTTIYLNFAYLWIIGGVFDTLVPLFGEDRLGLSPGGIGLVFAVVLAAELSVLYPAGSATDRLGRRFVAVPSTFALAAGAAALGLAGGPIAYALLMIPLGLASGFAGVPPGAMLSDIAPGQRSGTAVGIFRFAGDLGITLGPLAAGFATKHLGFTRAFMVCSIPVALGAVLAAFTRETLASRAGAR